MSEIVSHVAVHKAYPAKVDAIKKDLEKSHSVDGKELKTSQDGDFINIHLPNAKYNTVDSVRKTLQSHEDHPAYERGNVSPRKEKTMEDFNKLRKLAGLPMITEAKKKKDAPVMDADVPTDAAPTDAPPADGDNDQDDQDDLPAIVTKLAQSACKKFGLGDPKGGESKELTAMLDMLMKVYDAGVKDGAAQSK